MIDERRPEHDSHSGGGTSAAEEPTPGVLQRLLANLLVMAQTYGLLAARDLRLAVRDAVTAVVLLSTAMMFGLYLIGLLVAAAVLALSLVLPAWAAALIVLGGVAVMTGLLLLVMALKLRRIAGRLRAVVRTVQEDARWFRTRILRID